MAIARRVDDYLREHGADYELVRHSRTGSTHESTLAAHVPDDHIAKAVILREGGAVAMAVIRGDTWVDIDAVNRDTGRSFELDSESDLKSRLPDCVPGAVPPLGPAYGIETFVDDALATLAEVYFEAGDHEHLVRVSGESFVELLGGARRGRFSRED